MLTVAKPSTLIIVLTMSTFCHAQAAASKSVTVNGETHLALDQASVIVETHEATDPNSPSAFRNQTSACTGGRRPCLLTESFQIYVNGKLIYVPYSAFADLGDMGNIKLQHFAKKYLLTIVGGDAAASYIAKIGFDRTRVLDRVVSPGEDSTQPAERTMYYNPKRFE